MWHTREPVRAPLPSVLAWLLCWCAGCQRESSPGTGGAAPSTLSGVSSAAKAAEAAPPSSPSNDAPVRATAPPATSAPTIEVDGKTSWRLGKLADVAPAAPATASARGVALITKGDRLLWSHVDAAGHFEELDRPATDFARYGRGPALTEGHAYWINLDGSVMRSPLTATTTTTPERIAGNARSGARVSALRVGKRDLVAFVAESDGRTLSYLWASTGELVPLTPDVGAATSVTLVENGTTPLALTLEGRTGMSPVHAQLLRVAPQRVNVPAEQVLWVAPGSEPLTELSAVTTGQGSALALLATARNVTDFGLGHFVVEADLEPVRSVHWLAYPNGIDPAPVAAATLCGAPYVFFARPSDARPRSPQELRAARVEDGKIGLGEVIARSRAFNDISVAARAQGAVLAWTADRRTWAMTLGCPNGFGGNRSR